jgi:hypothetical protein
MTEHDPGEQQQRRPALGQPPQGADPDGDPDFASEHEETAVDDDIITGEDTDREPEAPRGWAGMEPSPHHRLSGY